MHYNLAFKFIIVFYITGFLSCTSNKEIKGFDKSTWIKDLKGCSGKRISIADSIMANKNLWKGMDDDVLIDLLGTPEKKFYYERNAKAFLYFIEPGNQCDSSYSNLKKEGRKLIAEVNATGFINIIRTEP